jgi:hypothetical protein
MRSILEMAALVAAMVPLATSALAGGPVVVGIGTPVPQYFPPPSTIPAPITPPPSTPGAPAPAATVAPLPPLVLYATPPVVAPAVRAQPRK